VSGSWALLDWGEAIVAPPVGIGNGAGEAQQCPMAMLAAETVTKVEPVAGVLVAALAYIALWLAVAAVAYLVHRPVEPGAGPDTQELGPEPPAVANLLTGTFEVSAEAMPATLIDLAARKLVELDTMPDGSTVCRLLTGASGRGRDAGLTPYESRVLGLLRSKALNGVVPAGALTTGTDERAGAFWKSFRKEVIADAQQRGLCRPVWGKGISSLLGAAALLPFLLLWAAGRFNPPDEVAWTPLGGVTIGCAVAVALLGARIAASDRQRGTDAGMEAGSRWLGVRGYLSGTVTFPDLPPAHVVLWERYLAYATAFGVARACVRALPMSAEPDRRAWSSYGGRWRQVKVRYPKLRPGWGMAPWIALARGLFFGGFAGFITYVLLVGVDPLGSIDSTDAANRYVAWAVLAVGLICLLVTLRLGSLVVQAGNDLFVTRTVEGEVLRERSWGSDEQITHWVALDTGTSAAIRAWRVSGERAAEVEQHQRVRARVTPLLGFVRSFERLPVVSE
jgi:hypothetical protein